MAPLHLLRSHRSLIQVNMERLRGIAKARVKSEAKTRGVLMTWDKQVLKASNDMFNFPEKTPLIDPSVRLFEYRY